LKKLFFILTLIFTVGITAQEIKVSGVVSEDSKAPLVGASIVVKGTQKGVSTDFDGKFTINAKIGDVLLVSYVGFETKSVTVKSRTLNVSLVASGEQLQDVVVTGSRNTSRVQINSAVAIDVLDIDELSKVAPQVNLNEMLNFVAPSFTSNTQAISDGTDHIDPASLRGLGPSQVLVLINGKRRHNTSLININGTFGRGSVGTDMNAIPAASIKKIEILRDGAAAQYGSDAIVGIINIILKKDTNKMNISLKNGAVFSKNANSQTGGVDGATTNISASYGVDLGKKGGFINFSGDFDVREEFNRMKEFEGNIFNKLNAIEWQAKNAGYDLDKLYPYVGGVLTPDYAAISTYAAAVPNIGNLAAIQAAAGSSNLATLRTLLAANFTTEELANRNMKRSDVNMRVGQSRLRGGRFFANMSIPLDDNGTELYAFSGMSSRTGNSAGFYRTPNAARNYAPMYVSGFLPEINSQINDKSIAIGIKGKISDWNVDFSNTYGKNQFLYEISNSSNASMLSSSPSHFDAGGFSFAQNTTNLDVTKFYKETFHGLNVAFGLEHRAELYEIYAGELGSYAQYDVNGMVITSPSQISLKDFFGAVRPAGSQVFPGFRPENEVSRNRTSVAVYGDLEADFTDRFLVSFATRFENYSDFGTTKNIKLASRYKLTKKLNLRASVNTGFRAPALHQIYFNSTRTVFSNSGNPREVGTFSNDSKAAKLLGIPKLKQETSKSISAGITANVPSAHLKITVDGYFVRINDRIVYTGQFVPNTPDLVALFSQAGATRAAFFANAIDTESRGLDVVITHNTTFGKAKFKTDLAGTFSKTRKIGEIHSSEVLKNSGQTSTYFDEEARIFLESAVPNTKIHLSNTLSINKFKFFLRNVYFGEVTEASTLPTLQQVFTSKIVTDLSISYKASSALSMTVGANNLLDIYPDRADLDRDPVAAGNQTNRSNGQFDWSRRSQQFGIRGRFLFARLVFNLK